MVRLLQDLVDGTALARRLVACYCLGSWVPLDLFSNVDPAACLDPEAALPNDGPDRRSKLRDVRLSTAPDEVGVFIGWSIEDHPAGGAPGSKYERRLGRHEGQEHPGFWRRGMGWEDKAGRRVVGTHPLTWVTNGALKQGATQAFAPCGAALEAKDYLGMVHPCRGLWDSYANAWCPNMATFMLKGYVGVRGIKSTLTGCERFQYRRPSCNGDSSTTSGGLPSLIGLSADQVASELQSSRGISTGVSVSLHPFTNEVLCPLPADAGRPGSVHLDYHMSDYCAFWFNIRANVALRLSTLTALREERAALRACAKDLCFAPR